MNKIIVTGSSGLIGSQIVERFCALGWQVHGIDNNMRMDFFGPQGDTRWNQARLLSENTNFKHEELDIRDRSAVVALIKKINPTGIVHTAAQPSHDLAAQRPFDDFDINAGGTLNLLEAARKTSKEIIFIHLSTNKVYGDAPNRLNLIEKSSRWDFADLEYFNGIDEHFPIDQSKHSLFGASKLAGDIIVQEYGRYFGMSTCCLRGGCLTGPNHSGVQQHGFLSYLIRCNLEGKKYWINGYQGKQVRDNLHADDVCNFVELFMQSPREGEVYNLGGGKENSISILESFERIERISGLPMKYEYLEDPRIGDHICYYSNLAKIKSHFPDWKIHKNLDKIFQEIYESLSYRIKNDQLKPL